MPERHVETIVGSFSPERQKQGLVPRQLEESPHPGPLLPRFVPVQDLALSSSLYQGLWKTGTRKKSGVSLPLFSSSQEKKMILANLNLFHHIPLTFVGAVGCFDYPARSSSYGGCPGSVRSPDLPWRPKPR